MESADHVGLLEKKLSRLQHENDRMREDLSRNVLSSSEASQHLIQYCQEHDEPLLGPPHHTKVEQAEIAATKCCAVM